MSVLASLTQRYSHIALFIFCEIIAFLLIVNFNHKQRDIFLHSSSLFSGKMLETKTDMSEFVNLKTANDQLKVENAALLQELLSRTSASAEAQDTSILTYDVIPAREINNGITSMRNYITIDQGSDKGISPSMGVITADGVVGVVKKVGKDYATILSLLHVDTRISASIKGENFFGTASWDGRIYNEVSVSDVPTHAQIAKGDTMVTNGYSTIFPKGIEIGAVKSYDINKNGAFYDVVVSPSVDFANLSHVYLLKGTFAEELISITADE